MSLIEQFHGAAADGTELTAIYAEQPAADVAFALIFAGHGLPRFVHWGRPLAAPGTVLAAYDALRPQRVSGALDETTWPSIMPTQSESWIRGTATGYPARRRNAVLCIHGDRHRNPSGRTPRR